MSRIGRMPITVPAGVDVTIAAGNLITVKGPKGTITRQYNKDMIIERTQNDDKSAVLTVSRPSDSKEHAALHGLTRSLLFSAVEGVSNGFKKELEVQGVGYRAQKQGKQLIMNLGFSHQVIVEEIDGITIDVAGNNKITISGIDKQKVGQFAAEVRKKRPPEPYKGKGIRYAGEVIHLKEGKTGAK